VTAIILTWLGLAGFALSIFAQFGEAVGEADRLRGAFEDGEPW
jgi:hypothetical protein